jgi:hypothetical protein
MVNKKIFSGMGITNLLQVQNMTKITEMGFDKRCTIGINQLYV